MTDISAVPPPEKQKFSEAELQEALADPEHGKHLTDLLAITLRNSDSRARERIQKAIALTIAGERWTDVSAATGLTWHSLQGHCKHHPFLDIWMAARDCGDNIRRQRRIDLADKHAIEGTDRPVFQQGALVGYVREWDHRLLQWLIEADEPSKYRPNAASVNVSNQVGVVVEFHNEPKPQPPTIAQDASQSVSPAPSLPDSDPSPDRQAEVPV